jgi:hypothetical protein
MPSVSTLKFEVGAMARSRLNTTSSALKGVPSWNLTFGRSLNRNVVSPIRSQDVARQGSTSIFLS